MNSARSGAGHCWSLPWLRWVLVAVLALAAWQGGVAQGPGGDRSVVSIAAYRAHLEQLDRVVAACQKQRNGTACSPVDVGADDRVQLAGATTRDVRYGWLRDLLDRAGKHEDTAPEKTGAGQTAKEPQARIDALLTQARERLSEDWREASVAAKSGPQYDAERQSLKSILARKEYRGVSDSSPRERFLEWLGNVLDVLFSKLAKVGSRVPWIGTALRVLFVVGVCVGLLWMLIRIERQSRIRLVPEPLTVSGAPSARDWQLWLADARSMAQQGLWREAIHFLYWASIARLESRGLWPADRARTPREYLGLLPASDGRRSNLITLTRSFERTWYGGRDADASDYTAALKLAAELGVE